MNFFGWLPDLADFRDFIGLPIKILSLLKDKDVPEKVDLTGQCSSIQDQLILGSCVAQATVSCLEYHDNKDGIYTDLSRLMLYYEARNKIGKVEYDSGCYIRDAIKTVNITGVCTEILWPYNISVFTQPPPDKCYENAIGQKAISYYRVTSLEEVKQALFAGFPVVFGVSIYESFMNVITSHTGDIPIPTRMERLIGGHAILAVGYDDIRRVIKFQNSWGTGWGDKGFGYLPYEFFKEGLCDDMWVITKTNYNN